MPFSVTAPRSELALAINDRLAEPQSDSGGARVLINVAIQPPNSLLHDGQAWKRYRPARILEQTKAALRRARRGDFLVHASYVFAGAPAAGLEYGDSLRPIIDAALEAEDLVLNGPTPACVLRLAYLYGPKSRNLRAYRRAFRLARPYWAGPSGVRQRFIHSDDAAAALIAASVQRLAGRVLSAADHQPVSFATFMDHFAKAVGNPLPLHLPGVTAPLSRLIIAREHMESVALPTARIDIGSGPPGFSPSYRTYRTGLRQVIEAWAS